MTSTPPPAPSAPALVDPSVPERVVLCGPDGSAIGSADKTDVHGIDTALHLAFSCYVFDSAGRVLVTRRAYGKRTFPGVRSNSCCGHPAPGEPIDAAVRRRVRDELGIELDVITLILPRFRYRAVAADGVMENELCPVLRATVGTSLLRPDPAEVAAAWWAPWSEFTEDDGTDDPLSVWSQQQLAELAALGADPMAWPAADPELLPGAASVDGHRPTTGTVADRSS